MTSNLVDLFNEFVVDKIKEPILIDTAARDTDTEHLLELCQGLEDLGFLVSYYHPASDSHVEFRPFHVDHASDTHSIDHLKLALRYGRVAQINIFFDSLSDFPSACGITADILTPGRHIQSGSARVTGISWDTYEECRQAVYDLVRINPAAHVVVVDKTVEVSPTEMIAAKKQDF